MRILSEDHKEIQSGKKSDDEGYMARLELDNIEKSVAKLKKVIKSSDQQLPAWVQSKITRGVDYINSAAEYLSSDEELDEEKSISFDVKTNPKRSATNAKLHKRTDPKRNPKPEVKNAENFLRKKGVIITPPTVKNSIPLAERILDEMIGDKPGWNIKKTPSLEGISKKHKLPIDNIKKQLKKGIKVEMEHTSDKGEAEIIALQHLEERPDYYTKLKKVEQGTIKEETKSGDNGLGDWIRKSSAIDPKTGKKVPGWVQLGGPFAGAPCARQPGQKSTPKCGSSKMAANLSDKEEEKAFNRKNRKDPNQPEKSGATKPTYVKTEELLVKEEKGKKDACYRKVKSRYRVWPSAYASLSLSKCRKVGADNWGNKSEEYIQEGFRIQPQSGQLMNIMLNWRNKIIVTQLFFPQIRIPKRLEVIAAVEKVYPGAKVISFRVCNIDPKMPLVQVNEAGPSLSVSRGEKLSVEAGGGLTAKGRAKYNRATGSNLKAPVTGEVKRGSKAWKRRKNFCSRSRSWKGPRGLAARRRWKC
jgi:hypothetical protein